MPNTYFHTTAYNKLISTLIALILILLIIAIYCHTLYISSHYLFHTDFFKFNQTARFYVEGQAIYDKIIYPLNDYEKSFWHSASLTLNNDLNPPFFTILLLPTIWLSYSTALLYWFALSLIVTVIALLLVFNAYERLWQNKAVCLWALAYWMLYFPNYLNNYIGQLSGFLLLITIIALRACHKNKLKSAGAFLGFALSIKLFYGIFLLLFAARKQWRAFNAMIMTFLVCSASALELFGMNTYKHYFSNLHNIYWYSSNWNASLLGFLTRLLGSNHEGNLPVFNVPQLTHPLYLIISAGLLIYFILSVRSPIYSETPIISRNDKDLLDWQFSMAIVLMLLISPLGWVYYFPLLIIPMMTILRLSENSADYNTNLILLCVITLLSSTPSHYRFPLQISETGMVFSWGSYYFYALILLFGLLLLLRKQFQTRNYQKMNIPIQVKFSPVMQILMISVSAIPSLVALAVAIGQN